MVGISAVDEARAKVQAAVLNSKPIRPKRTKKNWEPPGPGDFADGYVLSFDQTVSKTGWVFLLVYQGEISVKQRGILKEPPIPDLRGSADVLQRAQWMCERIAGVAQDIEKNIIIPGVPYAITHEMPAVAGHRTESSLMAALGVWQACSSVGEKPVMVSNTHMRAVLIGPKADYAKSHVTEALNRYLDTSKGWNGDTRDALALGLTYLYDKARA